MIPLPSPKVRSEEGDLAKGSSSSISAGLLLDVALVG